MKPETLLLKSFGPYPGEVRVDFNALAKHGLFLIHGPTGSGKSAILDGMTYALFGDTPGERGPERGGREFVSTLNDPQTITQGDRAHVRFTFSVSGERYRVTRYPAQRVARKRTRGGATDPIEAKAEAELVVLDAHDNIASVLADKPSDVTREVIARVGCSVDQFRQTVILPQGEFREVVTDEKTRRAVLERIFATARFKALTQALKNHRRDIETQGDEALTQQRNILTTLGLSDIEALSAARADAEAQLTDATEQRKQAQTARDTARSALESGERLQQLYNQQAKVTSELEAKAQEREEMAALEARLAEARAAHTLAVAFGQVTSARDEFNRALERESTTRDALPALREALTQAQEALDGVTNKEAEAARSSAQARLETLRVRQADVANLATLQREIEDAQRQVHELTTRLEAAQSTQKELRVSLETLRDEAPGARALASRASEAATQLAAARAKLQAHEQWTRLREAQTRITLAEPAERDALLQRFESHAASALARELSEGAACPVCGSTHHPTPHAHDDDWNAFKQALSELEAQSQQQAKWQALETQIHEILTLHDWLPQPPDRDALTLNLNTWTDTQTSAQAATARLQAIDAEVDALTHALDEAATTPIESERSGRQAALDEKCKQRDALLAMLPDDAREPGAFQAALTRAIEAVTALEDERHQAHEAQREAHTALTSAERQHSEATAARKEREATLATAQTQFGQVLHASMFESEDAFLQARVEPSAMQAWEATLRAWTTLVESLRGQEQALREQLADHTPPDLVALQAVSEASHAAWEAASDAVRRCERSFDTLQDALTAHARAGAAFTALEARLRAATKLARIAAGDVVGRAKIDLETFVLQQQFGQVLREGNRHLLEMSRGRYSMHVSAGSSASDTGLALEIADHHQGGARRPARTLSGGEGFVAALSLAFGLSEIARRSRYPIDALFIDEGFGSLDASALDQVTRTLRALPMAAGRMVGIISHVEALKRLIPVQLVIAPSERGSRVHMRVNDNDT